MIVNKGNSGKNSGIDFNLFKVGLKRESLKTESDKSIFDAIDTDKNAVVGTKRTRNKYDTQTIRKEAGELAQVIHNQISGLSNKNNTKNRLRAITPENAAFVVQEYQSKYKVSLAKDIDDEWGLDVKTVKEFVCKNLVDQAKRLGIKGVYYNDYQKITDISTLEKWINNVSNKIINHMKNAVETYYATDTEEAERTQQAQAKKTAKTSASQIVDDLIKSTKGYNDIDKIKAAVARIDSPEELEEVNRLLALKGYPPTDKYSAIENFIYQEANHSAVHTYNSSDYLEQTVQNWIDNGTLTGQAANEAQARMACRVIFDGGDGFGTDCNKIKKGVRMIKCPKPTGNAEEDNKQAREVYKLVDEMISKHKTFYGLGSPSKNLVDYCDGEMWDWEVKYLKGILGENEAIAGKEKAQAVADLTQEAVEGAGTNIESLKQAIKAISTPEDRKAVEEKLKEYCQKKGIKPQIEGQSYLQAILYDECDTFLGISTDHKEIRKFNEMLIEQGAYTEEEIVNLRAEQAALQILEGNFNNIKDAMEQIKDPAVLKKLNELLKTKGYNSLDDFFKQKLDQTKQDLINAELASNKLLDDQKAADVAYRLIKNSGFDKRAMGIRAIRTEAQAALVDEKLKQEGSSLAQVMEQFNKEKAENKSKAEFFDGWVKLIPGFSAISEEISDAYNKNTDSSDNLYVEMKQPQYLTDEQKAAYQMTVNIMEQKLAQMEKDYQAALDSQGAVSWAVNSFCERYGIGTTREEIEARIEHDKETIRLLKQAAEGKLGKMANGSTVAVSFEEVFKERNADTNFDTAKVEKVQNQAQMLVAMNYAKTNIAVCWEELENGLNSSDTKRLTVAITDTLEKLSNMAGTQLLLADGYSVKNSVIVDSNGSPVSADKLKAMATQLKQNLSDISKELLGREIPLNTPSDKMNKLLEKAFDSKKEDFKQEFKDAFGADCPDEMVENYISTIETGKFVANIGVMIGAAVAAPFTGGGTLAVFFMVGASSLGLNALEHSTDADGWTNSEWTSDVSQAFWDGLLGAAGVKIGQMAEMFAKGGNKVIAQNKWLAKLPKKEAVKVLGKAKNIADAMSSKSGQIGEKVLLAQKTKLLQMFPKLNTQTAEKISVMLARAEACGFEVTSDSLQSLVQTYCMEGQFDEETFLTALIISVAANTAGHGIETVGDVKKTRAAGGTDVDINRADGASGIKKNKVADGTDAVGKTIAIKTPAGEGTATVVKKHVEPTSIPKAKEHVMKPTIDRNADYNISGGHTAQGYTDLLNQLDGLRSNDISTGKNIFATNRSRLENISKTNNGKVNATGKYNIEFNQESSKYTIKAECTINGETHLCTLDTDNNMLIYQDANGQTVQLKGNENKIKNLADGIKDDYCTRASEILGLKFNVNNGIVDRNSLTRDIYAFQDNTGNITIGFKNTNGQSVKIELKLNKADWSTDFDYYEQYITIDGKTSQYKDKTICDKQLLDDILNKFKLSYNSTKMLHINGTNEYFVKYKGKYFQIVIKKDDTLITLYPVNKDYLIANYQINFDTIPSID